MAMVKVKMPTPRGWVIIHENDYDPAKHVLLERIEEPAPEAKKRGRKPRAE